MGGRERVGGSEGGKEKKMYVYAANEGWKEVSGRLEHNIESLLHCLSGCFNLNTSHLMFYLRKDGSIKAREQKSSKTTVFLRIQEE